MAQTRAEKMRTQRAKWAVVRLLRDMGEVVSGHESVRIVQSACARRGLPGRRGGESSREYFERIVRMAPQPKEEYVGEVVEAFRVDRINRPDYEPKTHLRAAEIDALPSPVCMGTTAIDYGWNR